MDVVFGVETAGDPRNILDGGPHPTRRWGVDGQITLPTCLMRYSYVISWLFISLNRTPVVALMPRMSRSFECGGCCVHAGCGRTLQDSTGEFGWPVQDSESTSLVSGGTSSSVSMAEPCQWRISGTHGERIVVNVSELRLASSDCVTDYLEVRDGHWYRSPLLGQSACGTASA